MQSRNFLLRLFAFVLAIFLLFPLGSYQAKAQVNFGGRIIFKMPVTTQPPPNTAIICPPHSVIIPVKGGKPFGVTGGRLYDYGNDRFAWVIGKYTPVPLPNCIGAIGVFWQVYPLLFMGTSRF